MTIKEIEKFVAENFPNLIAKHSMWNKYVIHWYHKDYQDVILFHTGIGYRDNFIWIFLPYRFISKTETDGTTYGKALPNSPVLPATETENKYPFMDSDFRKWKIKEISEMTLKFYLIDLQQQYLRIRDEVLRTTQNECQETYKG